MFQVLRYSLITRIHLQLLFRMYLKGMLSLLGSISFQIQQKLQNLITGKLTCFKLKNVTYYDLKLFYLQLQVIYDVRLRACVNP